MMNRNDNGKHYTLPRVDKLLKLFVEESMI